jgi:hypothetical protein
MPSITVGILSSGRVNIEFVAEWESDDPSIVCRDAVSDSTLHAARIYLKPEQARLLIEKIKAVL